MGKVLDFFELRGNAQAVQATASMVESLHPRIEALVDDVIADMFSSKGLYEALKDDARQRHLVDETIVTSLCFVLSRYLSQMVQRPNAFNLTEDTAEDFIRSLASAMFDSAGKVQ